MKLLLILTLILFSPHDLWAAKYKSDSLNRKLILELGNTFANMHRGNNESFRRSHPLFRYLSLTTYFYKSYFINTQYNSILIGTKYYQKHITNFRAIAPGEILTYQFNLIRLNVGKSFHLNRIMISPYVSGNRRFGMGEEIFIGMNNYSLWDEYTTSRTEYRSFGIGLGCSINYLFKKRLSIGTESNLSYNFEKINPQPGANIDPANYGVIPSRFFSTLHFKIGYMMF